MSTYTIDKKTSLNDWDTRGWWEYGVARIAATGDGYAVLGTVGIETKRYSIHATRAAAATECERINRLHGYIPTAQEAK